MNKKLFTAYCLLIIEIKNILVTITYLVVNTYYVEYEKRRRSPDILKLYAAYWSVLFHR